MKISARWWKMAEVYRRFADPDCDFSREAAEEMFRFESEGVGSLKVSLFGDPARLPNGYAVGKHWMDATVKMWIEGLAEGTLWVKELYDAYPHWWLDRVLPPAFVAAYEQGKLTSL